MAGSIELVSEEQVLAAVKSNGPVIPMDVRHIIKYGDTMTIGATLSILVERGVVKITNIKRGGSPFYYVEGQEQKLADLSKFLNEKDKRTFKLLLERKAIRDSEEEPLTRVSLRNMPDFAKRVDVEVNGAQEIFWRWYEISDEEAIEILTKKSIAKEEKHQEKDIVSASVPEKTVPEAKPVKVSKKKAPAKQEQQQQLQPVSSQGQQSTVQQSSDSQNFIQQGANSQTTPVSSFNDAFINRIYDFLSSNKITIKEIKQLKKSAEYDLTVEIPTPVGNVDYFCKVKGKKKCNEGDLSSAYVQGQGMRLPVLFLTTGEVVKKAKEKLKSDFKGMIVKEGV
jgi:hypothetical protein